MSGSAARSPFDRFFADLLLHSYSRLVGRPLIELAAGETAEADWLYADAPFCLLAHDGQRDPCFIYANRTAQACFGYSWDEFIGLPSRLSAEMQERAQREAMLEAVASVGFIADYSGIRIAKSGRRFWIENAVIWQIIDADGVGHGQAAIIRAWHDI